MKDYFRVFIVVYLFLLSCTNLDDVNNRLDTQEKNVSNLQAAILVLQRAYDEGKIVTKVTSLQTEEGGWLISFSDNSSISLNNGCNGKDAIAPIVRINPINFQWEISIDGGTEWTGTGIVAKGEPGQNFIAPLIRINPLTSEWEISTDSGITWESTGVIAQGKDGDAFFNKLVMHDGYVTFELTDGTSFTFKMDSSVVIPKLLSFEFRSSANSYELIDDANCTIIGDSVVECWIRHIMDDKRLIPHFLFDGDAITIDNQDMISDVTRYDFRKPVKLTVKAADLRKNYTVYVHAFTGLPVLWIETEGRVDITSKKDYLNAHFKLVEDVKMRSAGDVTEINGQIKGRGNSTWAKPKKPYRLKFDKKVEIFGGAKDKSWVLLANYTDKTSIRNATAFYMGSISNLDYTPRFHFVEVMLNGRYNGTYQLGDKLKISKNRVNVGDDGILMEIDVRASGELDTRYFKVAHIIQPISIKDPDVEYDDDIFTYAKNFLTAADEALFSDNFIDENEGWQKYIDIDSFVDWYLINEIAKNNDACFFSSCYMNLKRGGKLKMGPLWDFDIAFGNVNYNGTYDTEGFWIKDVEWFDRLFQDPVFVAKIKERFDYFYNHQSEILNEINENASYLMYSVEENNNKWGTLYNYTWPNYDIWGSYQNEVQSLKRWIVNRFEWLKNEFEKF